MKFNLKNRPRENGDNMIGSKEATEWFEGFEKELREKIKTLEEADNLGDSIIASELKEILGLEGPAEAEE